MPIKNLSIEITRKCNLNCPICHIADKEKEIQFGELKDFLDKNLSYVTGSVTLTGGEPFLYPNLRDIIDTIHLHKLHSLVISNGTFKPELLEEIRPTTIKISLDAPNVKHDIFRNRPGLYENILKIIKKAKENKINAKVICTISKHNLTILPEMLKWEKENEVPVYFNRYVPHSLSDVSALSKTELKKLFSFIKENDLHKRYMGGLKCLLGTVGGYCAAGGDRLHLSPEGITMCMFHKQIIGTINDSLKKIHKKAMHIRTERIMLANECSKCENFGNNCRGDCLAIADLYQNNKGQCWK